MSLVIGTRTTTTGAFKSSVECGSCCTNFLPSPCEPSCKSWSRQWWSLSYFCWAYSEFVLAQSSDRTVTLATNLNLTRALRRLCKYTTYKHLCHFLNIVLNLIGVLTLAIILRLVEADRYLQETWTFCSWKAPMYVMYVIERTRKDLKRKCESAQYVGTREGSPISMSILSKCFVAVIQNLHLNQAIL